MEGPNQVPKESLGPIERRTVGEPTEDFHSQNKGAAVQLGIAFLVLGVLSASFFIYILKSQRTPSQPSAPPKIGFEKFTSEEEFSAYLETAAENFDALFGQTRLSLPSSDLGREEMDLSAPIGPVTGAGKTTAPERVSETTVQVKGIDEPDIVKTDGQEIYFSSGNFRIFDSPAVDLPTMDKRGLSLPQGETKVIKAFPPADLAQEAKIERNGNLLLYKDILIVFGENNQIYGYDVSDPESPVEEWKVDLENNNFLVDARLYQGKVYFIIQTRLNPRRPCPIVPLSLGGKEISIQCTDIYRPTVNIPVDVTYTAFILDPQTGEVEKTVSFVGSSGSSILYMSKNALYATYTYSGNMIDFFYDFFLEEGQDLVPDTLIGKLKTLRGYDLSSQAKMIEFQTVFEQHLVSLDDDERLRIENEFANRMENYIQKRQRGLEKTGLVKLSLDDFKILATGNIPGRPLNQFSLDEYQNHLRVATTVGGESWGATESANDVYVLDNKLRQVGSVLDLGLDEKIYSARFIEDKGYLVTFKEIDPFFVIDLSNPKQPAVTGELKIPGYSSYLHPITKDKILGVGKEGRQVKASLFDVASPDNPTEASKYLLDESWSDILNTHHAFLLDQEHGIFFLPGSKGGYVFSYQNDQLKLIKAVASAGVRRAIYINDYLYLVGDRELIVLNENDWEQVNKLEF